MGENRGLYSLVVDDIGVDGCAFGLLYSEDSGSLQGDSLARSISDGTLLSTESRYLVHLACLGLIGSRSSRHRSMSTNQSYLSIGLHGLYISAQCPINDQMMKHFPQTLDMVHWIFVYDTRS